MSTASAATPTSKGDSESGASRTRTGDLLGAIHQIFCVDAPEKVRISRTVLMRRERSVYGR
jgi:hypothetical protein